MTRKNEHSECKPSLQEELSSMRKKYAGQKGQIGLLQRNLREIRGENDELYNTIANKDGIINSLRKQIGALRDTCKNNDDEIIRLRRELSNAKQKLADYKALPWYKKIF